MGNRQSPGFTPIPEEGILFHYCMDAYLERIQPTHLGWSFGRTFGSQKWGILQAAWMTPHQFQDNQVAKKSLALGYRPRAGYILRPTYPLENVEIKDSFGNPDGMNRVAPAFGQPGGGWETILTKGWVRAMLFDEWNDYGGPLSGDHISLTPSPLIPDDRTAKWTKLADDIHTKLDDASRSVASAFDDAMGGLDESFPRGGEEEPRDDEEGGSVAVSQRAGGIVAWLRRRDGLPNVSISLARSYPHDGSWHVHATYWKDGTSRRYLRRPIHVEIRNPLANRGNWQHRILPTGIHLGSSMLKSDARSVPPMQIAPMLSV